MSFITMELSGAADEKKGNENPITILGICSIGDFVSALRIFTSLKIR
jgi:hypothetical protein